MFRNGLLSKFFVVIFLTILSSSFTYAGEGEGNDKDSNSSLNADKDGEGEGNDKDSNSSLNADKDGNNQSVVTSLPEKDPETSILIYVLIIITFLLIVLHIAFKIERTPRFTIKRRLLMKTKGSTRLSEGSNQSDLSTLKKDINDMNQTFMTLKTNLDQKDEEISRYKDGYDAAIYKNFLLRFTRVDKVIKEYLGDNKIDINGLQDIQIQMDDALAECGVEIFSPEIGADFKSTIGVADNPEIRETSDKSKDSTIAEILMPGYRRKLPSNDNDDYQIIIEAKVAIYVYKET
jgi:molecular chaperone GrpE (heat shock protein)